MKEEFSLSWLVQNWPMWDDIYIKNIWLNTESRDIVRILEDMDTNVDIEENYIDIEQNIDKFHCMPNRDSINIDKAIQKFMSYCNEEDKAELSEVLESDRPYENFRDAVYDLGLDNKFNEFKDRVSAAILYNWANDESINVDVDMKMIDLDKEEF
ncbi:MAG: UPF0158 family protein [Tissierellia bacterium]|nr:UPF0158 family protein [Tissierellia bacterium]